MSDEPSPKQLVLGDVQPWLTEKSPDEVLAEKREERRRVLLETLAGTRFAQLHERVALVLRDHPETRDSDTALLIRYWKRFQPDHLADWSSLGLDVLFNLERVESIIRARRRIQNDLHLFRPSARTLERRGELQLQFSQYAAAQRTGDPEIHFYLDEAGNGPQDRFTGIGGICILNVQQFEIPHAGLRVWRERKGWPQTLHFADITDDPGPFLKLLEQVRRIRAGLLFVGYAISTRQSKEEIFFGLITQLVVDAVRKIDDLGCLDGPRAVRVFKEKEDGFDTLFLERLEQVLHEHLAREFPNRAYLKAITPLPKGREVLLECADMIASAMRRRELSGGRHSKDQLAEAVMNVTGFEDVGEQGALFKYFQPRQH